MNAAFSPVGHAFAARWADIAFVSPDSGNHASAREKATTLRELASGFGRQIQVWASASVLTASTESEARRELAHFLALVTFDCRLEKDVEVSTHTIFIGEVEDVIVLPKSQPLVYVNGEYVEVVAHGQFGGARDNRSPPQTITPVSGRE
jgi:alkanesulfonate monooxygenase SsuD/methylene tetrahydromethanopterin reductase-like flavin-dependent oxidoreductase (luciferase family)